MKGNEIVLYGSVGAMWDDVESFTSADVRNMLDGRSGDVTVRINSGGGIATEGLAIYTMLRDYASGTGKVHIIVDAMAASAASLIAMAGDTITMRLGAVLLIHDPAAAWAPGRGTEADHLEAAAQLSTLADAYAEVYAARSGLSKDRCREIMRAETLMDGDEALSLGFATAKERIKSTAAAPFAYALYANAPAQLREAHASLGLPLGDLPKPEKEALMTDVVTPAVEDVVPAVEAPVEAAAVETETETPEVVEAVAEVAVVEEITDLPPTPETVVVADAGDLARERTRTTRILNAASLAGVEMSVATDLIERGVDEATALETILQTRSKESDAMSHRPATITADARDKFAQGVTLALMAKVGLGGERNEFSSLSLAEMARESLVAAGQTSRFNDRRSLVGAALMQQTSDFADILANVAQKSAMKGWTDANETYDLWTRKSSVTNFQINRRVALGQFGALPVLAEGASYTQGTIGDRGENIAVATYGRQWTITRQAIINDDLGMLSTVPTKMGIAARRTVGNLAYAVLTSNPLMADGVALFAVGHNNLGAGALSATSLAEGRRAMKVQTEDGVVIGVSPKFLIVPAALETAADQLMKSVYEVANSRGHSLNPVAGMAQVIADARLDANSATAFYLAADPLAHDTIEIAYLDGNDTPYVEQEVDFDTDGLKVKVRIDAGVAPMAHQGLWKSTGI